MLGLEEVRDELIRLDLEFLHVMFASSFDPLIICMAIVIGVQRRVKGITFCAEGVNGQQCLRLGRRAIVFL
jgi:hypothetical protein